MEVQAKHRDFYFDTLKGFLILCVIIGNSLELADPQNINTHYFILFLYVFHMPLFTFVSGYFSKLSKRTTAQKVKETFKIYFFAQLAYTIFYRYILGNTGHKFELFYPKWTLWYLLSLTCWYVLSDYVTNNKKWFIGSIIVSLLIGFDGTIGSLGSVSRTIFFLPFFIAGMTFDKKYINIIKKHLGKLLTLSIAILAILFFLSPYIKIDSFFEYSSYSNAEYSTLIFPLFVRAFHYIAAFTVGALILGLVPNIKTIITPIGRSSLILYLLHSGVSDALIYSGIARYDNIFYLIISEFIIVIITVILTFAFLKLKKIYYNKKISTKN